MEKYADHYINIDKKRLLHYHDFNKTDKNKNFSSNFYIFATAINSILIFKFKSLIICPIFMLNFYFLHKFLNYQKENCYFCYKTQENFSKKQYYNLYYKCIEKVFERNEKIKNLDDFEKELDCILKEKRI